MTCKSCKNCCTVVAGQDFSLVPKWFISATKGDDGNSGQCRCCPIETWAELEKRLGPGFPLLPGKEVDTAFGKQFQTTVQLLSDTPDTDPMRLRVSLPKNGVLAILADAKEELASGVIDAVTPLSRSTNTRWAIAANPYVLDFTPYIGKRLRITSGVNEGQVFFIQTGGATAIITAPNDPDLDDLPASLVSLSPTQGAVAHGDPFVIEDLYHFSWGDLDVRMSEGGDQTVGGLFDLTVVGFANLNVRGNGDAPNTNICSLVSGGIEPVFKGCTFSHGSFIPLGGFGIHWMVNCFFQSELGFANLGADSQFIVCLGGGALGDGTVFGPGSIAFARAGGMLVLDMDFVTEGMTVVAAGGQVFIGTAGVFNSGSSGVQTGGTLVDGGPAGSVWNAPFLGGTYKLYGSGNVDAGLQIGSGTKFGYGEKGFPLVFPSIVGLADEFTLGGVSVARAWDDASGAYTEAGGPATRATTWANLAATIGAGGFGGSAHNVQQDSHILDCSDLT